MARSKRSSLTLFLIIIILGFALTLSDNSLSTHVASSSSYDGAEYCGSCHSENYADWNETHHATMAGISEINASGTFYWVHAPNYTVMDQASFVTRCAKCHVTGWDSATQTWPNWNSTDPDLAEKFLNVQCEVCHGPGMTSMVVNYSSALCGQCHTQYGDWTESAHSESIDDLLGTGYASDYCLSCMSSQGFLGETVFVNTTGLEPVGCATCHTPHSEENENYLRYENSTELCNQCHRQGDVFEEGPHDMAGLECASCHGQGTRMFHDEEEAWFNHTFWIYNTYYPFNQTDPIVCSSCHTQSWATQMLGDIQTTVNVTIQTVENAITRTEEAIDVANQSGAPQAIIEEAENLLSQAESYLSTVEHDNSLGFHNPMYTVSLLNSAMNYTNEAYVLVTKIIPEFPSGLVLTLFMIVTLIAVAAIARKKIQLKYAKR